MQLRIEAQGKYLQKIIEEQQKLGVALKASGTSSSAEGKDNLSSPPQMEKTEEPASSTKKQKVDNSPADISPPVLDPLQPDTNTDFIGQWEEDLYGRGTGFGFSGVGFKNGEADLGRQEQSEMQPP